MFFTSECNYLEKHFFLPPSKYASESTTNDRLKIKDPEKSWNKPPFRPEVTLKKSEDWMLTVEPRLDKIPCKDRKI